MFFWTQPASQEPGQAPQPAEPVAKTETSGPEAFIPKSETEIGAAETSAAENNEPQAAEEKPAKDLQI